MEAAEAVIRETVLEFLVSLIKELKDGPKGSEKAVALEFKEKFTGQTNCRCQHCLQKGIGPCHFS